MADVVFILFRLLAAIFHSRLTALINFLFGSRQEPISFRLHGASHLTAVINVLLASRRDSVSFQFAPDGDIDILSPHGDNSLQATSSSVVQMITNSVDTLILEGRLLSWYIMDIRNQPTELALSEYF